MASATTRLTFTFSHHLNHHHHPSKLSKPHLHLCPNSHFPPSLSLRRPTPIAPHSVDVSQDDKPTQEQEDEQAEQDGLDRAQQQQLQAPQNIDPRRLEEEKFAVLNTGIYECKSCGYKYDESVGDPSYPVPPGLEFAKLPDDWRCPTCGAAQSFFESKRVEIAGFEQNQQFGFGGNSLTSGQKALLIYGSLLLAFVLFLSGYFLQ